MKLLGIKADKNLAVKEYVSTLCNKVDWKLFVSASILMKTHFGRLEGPSKTHLKVSTPNLYVKVTFTLGGCVILAVTNVI